jgi:hypothetical protein
MQREKKLGFRSSFNFVPEGDYRVTKALRDELIYNGFEVGVHDLHHDGKLYRSRRGFSKRAERINTYLKEWDAVGFRSGFMLHRLAWLHELNVLYEASTFDVDPFEPQPDGVGTIFPFWVPQSGTEGRLMMNQGDRAGIGFHQKSSGLSNDDWPLIPPGVPHKRGYVELPYTLPQDSTLFLVLGERNPDIWFEKLDWIATHGGMVLVNTHPDYMGMKETTNGHWEYPIAYYERLLERLKSKYAGAFWLALPREIATYWNEVMVKEPSNEKAPVGGRKAQIVS